MTRSFIISGTDTGIGKTTVAAMLALALDAYYWKPVQSGTLDGTDRASVETMTGLKSPRIIPEKYILSQPLSPHRAAELDDISIDTDQFSLPTVGGSLIVEGAGGLLVPLTRQTLQIDLFASWRLPIILCARTELGTINHTLLSIEAVRYRRLPLHGIIFVGNDNADNMKTIGDFAKVTILGHMPYLEALNPLSLRRTFEERFRVKDFI